MSRDIEVIDSIEYEVINSQEAKIIFEIPVEYENDEEITMPNNCLYSKINFCKLDGENLFTGFIAKSKTIQADLVVKKENLEFIAESLENLVNAENPWDLELKSENNGDSLSIFFQSNWGHTIPAPYERIVVKNYRKYVLDGLRSHLLSLELPKQTARKVAEELKKYLNRGEN